MQLTMLRSKRGLDRSAEADIGVGSARGAEQNNGFVHTHFDIDDYPGESPHARVSIGWDDVENLIRQFADKGHPVATRLLRAERLIGAIEEVAKNSN